MILNILLTLPLLYSFQTAVTFINVNSFYIFGATLSIGTFGPISMYIVALYNLYPNWKQKLVKLPLLTVLGTGIAINNTKAWLEALMGIKSSFIRTPKLAIGNKAENLNKKAKYNNAKIGMVPMLELLGRIHNTHHPHCHSYGHVLHRSILIALCTGFCMSVSKPYRRQPKALNRRKLTLNRL